MINIYIYICMIYMIYIYMYTVYICIYIYIPNKQLSPNISQDVQWIQRTYIIWGLCLLDWSRRSPLLFGGHVLIGMQHPHCKTLATTATTILCPNSKCAIRVNRVSNFKFPSLFGMLFDHFCETCLAAHPTNRNLPPPFFFSGLSLLIPLEKPVRYHLLQLQSGAPTVASLFITPHKVYIYIYTINPNYWGYVNPTLRFELGHHILRLRG